MKKKYQFRPAGKLLAMAALALAAMLLVSCGSNAASNTQTNQLFSQTAGEATGAAKDAGGEDTLYAPGSTAEAATPIEGGATQGNFLPQDDRKVVLTADLSIETLEFDATCNSIRELVEKSNGYFSSSNTSASISGYARDASFTVKIPAENYSDFLDQLKGKATIVQLSENAEDITAEYVDVEARLTALQTQEARLLELMAQAETVEDLIAIQDKLASVQYEIEHYTATQRTYDKLIAYSTLYISVQEVKEITPAEPDSYWSRVKIAFAESWNGTVAFVQGFGIFIIFALPVIILGITITLVVIFATKKRRRKKQPAAPGPYTPAMPPAQSQPPAAPPAQPQNNPEKEDKK